MMATQQQIAKEHGESFERVIRGYAEAGHSMTGTAMIIGYNVSSFVRLCDRHGWRGLFKSSADCVGRKEDQKARRGAMSPAQAKAMEAMREANPGYVKLTYQGVTSTIADHARRVGVSARTVYNRRRAHGDADLDYLFSKRNHTIKPSTKDHAWKRSICGPRAGV